MSVNQTQHRHVDLNLEVVTACPAAAANVDSAGIDVRAGGLAQPVNPNQTVNLLGNTALQDSELRATLDVGTVLASTKKVTITPQDSDDNVTFTALADLAAGVVTGISANGNAKTEFRWKLGTETRRYVGVNIAVESGGGSIIAQNVTLDLLT